MSITALDTHEVVKDLTAAGFTEHQAEAVTRWVRKSQNLDLSSLATKSDLAATKSDLEASLASTKSDLEASLASTKFDLTASLAATKSDLEASLAATKSDLEASLASTKADLQISLAETKSDLLKWMVGSVGLQTVVILGAVIALARVMAH